MSILLSDTELLCQNELQNKPIPRISLPTQNRGKSGLLSSIGGIPTAVHCELWFTKATSRIFCPVSVLRMRASYFPSFSSELRASVRSASCRVTAPATTALCTTTNPFTPFTMIADLPPARPMECRLYGQHHNIDGIARVGCHAATKNAINGTMVLLVFNYVEDKTKRTLRRKVFFSGI